MNRCFRVLVAVAFFGLLLSVGWTQGQGGKDKKDKGKKGNVGPRQIVIDFPTPFPTNDGDNPFDVTTALVATGSNDSTKAVYGMIIDPDAPDTPISGITDPNADGSNPDPNVKWKIKFDANTLVVKAGYILRVVDTYSGNSQDCIFNITSGTASNVVGPIPDPEVCSITFAKVAKKFARIRTTIRAFDPKYVHGELFDPATKKVYPGKTYKLSDRTDKKREGKQDVAIEVDVTGIQSGTALVIRVHSIFPHGNKQKSWTMP